MAEEIIEISELQAKRLYLTAERLEAETGIAMPEVLIDIIYNSDDDQARVDAIRIFLAVMFNTRLDMDSIMEGPNLAEVLSLNSE